MSKLGHHPTRYPRLCRLCVRLRQEIRGISRSQLIGSGFAYAGKEVHKWVYFNTLQHRFRWITELSWHKGCPMVLQACILVPVSSPTCLCIFLVAIDTIPRVHTRMCLAHSSCPHVRLVQLDYDNTASHETVSI